MYPHPHMLSQPTPLAYDPSKGMRMGRTSPAWPSPHDSPFPSDSTPPPPSVPVLLPLHHVRMSSVGHVPPVTSPPSSSVHVLWPHEIGGNRPECRHHANRRSSVPHRTPTHEPPDMRERSFSWPDAPPLHQGDDEDSTVDRGAASWSSHHERHDSCGEDEKLLMDYGLFREGRVDTTAMAQRVHGADGKAMLSARMKAWVSASSSTRESLRNPALASLMTSSWPSFSSFLPIMPSLPIPTKQLTSSSAATATGASVDLPAAKRKLSRSPPDSPERKISLIGKGRDDADGRDTPGVRRARGSIGKGYRQCGHCAATTSPTWRRGPEGITLCNGCGIRYGQAKRTTRSMRIHSVLN